MDTGIFLRQLQRGWKRTLLNMLLLAAVTAFFAMSVNLYANSRRNIRLAEETYSTIAVTELYADVDKYGNVLTDLSDGYAGYLPTAVKGYDLTGIVASEYVEDWDLRTRWGAYIPDSIPTNRKRNTELYCMDLIRFVIRGDQPVDIPVQVRENRVMAYHQTVPVQVLDSASGIYAYEEELEMSVQFFGEEDYLQYRPEMELLDCKETDGRITSVTLYPGVEYLGSTCTMNGSEGLGLREDGRIIATYTFFQRDWYGYDYWVEYRDSQADSLQTRWDPAQPFWLYRREDVESSAELKAYFEQVALACRYSARSFQVCGADDVLGVTAFHLGAAFLREGRMIAAEEYASGAPVCMVSDVLAKNMGWQLGDKLDMSLYDYDAFTNQNVNYEGMSPQYTQRTRGIFHRQEYEIVGIFSQRELAGTSTVSESAVALPWSTIYVPQNAIKNVPDTGGPLIHGSVLTLWIQNGKTDDFLAEMEKKGITVPKTGGYAAQFTFYDQGYSLVQPSLEAMGGTAGLLLALSSALLAVTAALLAWFFAQHYKQTVGILRMLGSKKGRALALVLLSAALVAVTGMALGAWTGHSLTGRVGQAVLASQPEESPVEAAFRAYLMSSREVMVELTAAAERPMTLLAFGCGCLLFLTLVLLFVLGYIHREPRALLPGSKA